MLNMAISDDCCGKSLNIALSSGALDNAETWTHEKCGQVWRAEMIDVTSFSDSQPQYIRSWKPEVQVWVL